MRLHLTFAIFLISITAFSRENITSTDTTGKEGVIIKGRKYQKHISILMKDSTLGGNRFDYYWHSKSDFFGTDSLTNFLLTFYFVDSLLSYRADSILLNNIQSSSNKITSYPKREITKLLKNYYRLYVGYIDDKENLNVVVQFVSPKEYKKDKLIYSKQLFLVVPRKELHFAVVKFNAGEYN